MLHYIAAFCKRNNIKFVITSTIRSKERNAAVGAISMTHVEGRAVDFSIKPHWGWSDDLVWMITREIERNYKEFGAYSLKGGKQVVIFSHSVGESGGYHTHLQVRRDLPWE